MARYRYDGSRLHYFRESNGLSREELAVRLGCSVSRVAHCELSYHVPRVESLQRFALALGCRLEDLLVLDDEPEVAQ